MIDFDNESIIMNMWYKLVEGKLANFEILAKFLIHNLSACIVKESKKTFPKSKSLADQEYER